MYLELVILVVGFHLKMFLNVSLSLCVHGIKLNRYITF